MRSFININVEIKNKDHVFECVTISFCVCNNMFLYIGMSGLYFLLLGEFRSRWKFLSLNSNEY